MKKVLKLIKNEMAAIPVDYHFMKNKKSKPTYPYYVGELLPVEPVNEDGCKEYTFVLTGFNRGSILDLLESAETIEEHFPSVEGISIVDGNEVIVVYSNTTQVIDSGAEELQKVQINLTIKTWKGGN
ncbi:MAG: hypothetical protein ACERKZ_02445 [Lachnotalea sp.]